LKHGTTPQASPKNNLLLFVKRDIRHADVRMICVTVEVPILSILSIANMFLALGFKEAMIANGDAAHT
jgi:hypothetical protein